MGEPTEVSSMLCDGTATNWRGGTGEGDMSEYLGKTDTREACEILVRTSRPTANGASYNIKKVDKKCEAVFGMSSSIQWKSGGPVTCLFSPVGVSVPAWVSLTSCKSLCSLNTGCKAYTYVESSKTPPRCFHFDSCNSAEKTSTFKATRDGVYVSQQKAMGELPLLQLQGELCACRTLGGE